MEEDQKKEAIKRMEILNMSKQCINAFKKGIIWESEGIGALYECNEKEKQLIKDFETDHKGYLVYHLIHNNFEFGECYTILFISDDKKEWKEDIEDIKEGCTFSYVKNIDVDWCSEFGSVGIKPSIGGLVRTS